MREGNSIIHGAWRAALIWLAVFFGFSTILACATLAAQQAAGTPVLSVAGEATAPKIHELLTLLADPGVQTWLKQQNETKPAAASQHDLAEESISQTLDTRIAAIREHIIALVSTVPDLPNQFWQG